jgi:predicted nucleic-acid-binding protein
MSPERAFINTNLFLRFLTNDVPEQADAVERLLQRAGVGEIELVTNSQVIAEIVWTLESFYGLAPEDIKTKVMAILATPGVEVDDSSLVLQAIADYAEYNVDYAVAFSFSPDQITPYVRAWSRMEAIPTIRVFFEPLPLFLPSPLVIRPTNNPVRSSLVENGGYPNNSGFLRAFAPVSAVALSFSPDQ